MPLRAMLVLYVLDRCDSCERAWTAVLQALRRYDAATIELSRRNMSRIVERTPADRRILVVPTLVMTAPHEEQIVGKMAVEDVVALLARAGIEPIVDAHE